MEEVPRCTSLAPFAFPCFVLYVTGVEREGLSDCQGRAGIISIARWNLRLVIFSGISKPRFWGTYVLHPGFLWFSLFLWSPRMQHSTPLFVAVWAVFVVFVIPVVFVKRIEFQNLGLAKPRFRNTRYSARSKNVSVSGFAWCSGKAFLHEIWQSPYQRPSQHLKTKLQLKQSTPLVASLMFFYASRGPISEGKKCHKSK